MLPFSADEFFAVFRAYNQAIWPAPIVAYMLGIAALAFLARPGPGRDRLTWSVLALMWLWTGVAYHGLFFAPLNPAARVFAVAFVGQGLLFVLAGWTGRLRFGWPGGIRGAAGAVLIAYALVLYPLIGSLTGHAYPSAPVFGVTPCPVTLFTFGCLLLTTSPVPAWLLVVPLLWSLIGGSAAFLLGVPQDWVLLASGVLAIVLMMRGRPTAASSTRLG